jgi:hypothetical protein
MSTAAGVAGGVLAAGALRDLLGGSAHASQPSRDHETLARKDAQEDAQADQDEQEDAQADAADDESNADVGNSD